MIRLTSAIFTVLAFGAGCLETVPVEDDNAIKAGASNESDTTDDAPCRAGKTDCDGVCVDLQADDANCGACGFSCLDGYYYQGDPFCKFGECMPTMQGCLREDSGFATCAEFCGSLGEECRGPDDASECGSTIELNATTFPDECWTGVGTHIDADCDAPIPYNYVLGPHTFDVAHCCCTHTPQ
jgi:hypothetical protein